MPEIGQILSHYSIVEKIGKGGMGEVFRAKDLNLGREVAIKLLPEAFARDPERVARFEREAKLLASLNHPNIAAIYGLEESGGTHFLVLELVEGETLADQIAGKNAAETAAVPDILNIALQIAEALEAAHEKGIIHRDLKPANIKVTPDGKVKVLDFGLAKAFAAEQADLNLSNSPTLSNAATQQGIILGTAAYMSPEQARGKSVDKRADIWAFGVVLFEMLTGKQLFMGETVSDTLAAVLTKEPDFSTLPENLHTNIIEILGRCLKKDSRNRYHDIADARIDIQAVLADPRGVFMLPAAEAEIRRVPRKVLPWIAAFILTAIVVGVAIWHLKPPPPYEPRRVMHFDYDLPEGQQFGNLMERALALSPDGSRFVYKTDQGLYLRSMDELNAKLIPGTEGAYKPFFSPDSQWIGFIVQAERKLKKFSVNGGAPVPVADNIQSTGFMSWEADNAIVYATSEGIWRVSADGGNPELLIKGEGAHIAPQILPDGKTVMYTTGTGPFIIMLQSLESRERKELFEGDTAQYLPTGHIVYASENSLVAVPFDFERLAVTGSQISVVDGILREGGAPQYAVSDSGALIYIPGRAASAAQRTLVWVDRNGTENSLSAPGDAYGEPRISPDGNKVALEIRSGGNSYIKIHDLTRETMANLISDGNNNSVPVWGPDAERIVFVSYSPNTTIARVLWKAADGVGEIEELCSTLAGSLIPQSWSSDGKSLVLTEYYGLTNDISLLSMEGDRDRKPLLQDRRYSEDQPQISPDGKWLAYVSDESGQYEVYLRPFPEVNRREKVSINGGDSPLWSPYGRELFYRNGDSVLAVAVEFEPVFRLQKPEVLFRKTYVGWTRTADLHPWDIHPDGTRFLMMKESEPAADPSPQRINIVLNWFEELKRLAPIK